MKSRRSWLMGLALGAALFFGTPSAQAQFYNSGVPGAFTYQGLLADNGIPLTGVQNVTFTVSLTDSKQTTLWTETLQDQQVVNGIFNLLLGAPANPFVTPSDSLTFNEQYFMTVVATTSNGSVTLGPTPLETAPYALNAGTVDGILASATPVAGELFPVPLGTGYTGVAKVDPAFLPTIPNNLLQNPDIQTINNQGPTSNGNFQVFGSGGITVTTGTNEITISGGSSGAVTSITAGSGINISSTSPNGTGDVTVNIAPGGITGSMLGAGAVTGQKISGIAGMGLTQDAAGLLDVNVDNTTIGITSLANGNLLEVLPGGIGAAQLANGSVTNAKLQFSTIGATSNGSINLGGWPVSLGGSGSISLNTANSNTWTVNQNFTGITNTGAISTTTLSSTGNITDGGTLAVTGNTTVGGTLGVTGATTTNGITNTGGIGTGTLTSTGNVTDGGNLSVAGTSNLAGNTTIGGTLGVTGATTLSSTLNVTGATTTTSITNSGNIGTATLSTTGNITDGGNLTVAGTTTLTGLETANGGIQDNGILNSTGASNIGSGASINNSFGTGPADNNTIGTTAGGTNTINGTNTFNGNSTFNGTAAFGTNKVSGSDFVITGGSIDNTPIGAATPNTGAFTTLSSSSTSNIGTGASLNNTFGSGATSVNTFGNGTGSTNTFGSGAGAINYIGDGANTTNTIGFGDDNLSQTGTFAVDDLNGKVVIDGGSTTDGTKLVVDGVPTLVGAVPSGGYEVVVNGDEQVSGTLTVNAFSATTMEADNGYFHNLGGYVPGTPINLVDNIVGSNQAPGTPGNPGGGGPVKIDNVNIGSITPGTGAFTTLTSSGNTTLATGAGTTNTFGSGSDAANTFGNVTGTNAVVGTTTVTGTTNINTSGTALTTVGGGTNQTWLDINGVVTPWAGAGTLPAAPFALSSFEQIITGDEEVTGTIYSATVDAGNVWAALLSSPNIAFNNAQSYTANTSMTFNLNGNTTVPTVTINGTSASGVYGLQVTAGAAAGSNGVQITHGAGGGGIGLNIDPFTTGIVVSSSADGIDITSGPNSISASNLITTATNVNVGGAANSTTTTGLYQIGNTTVLTTVGTGNIFAGANAGTPATPGNYNADFGYYAGGDGATGSENTFTGAYAGEDPISGSFNTGTGYTAGYDLTSGAQNTYIGAQSGGNNNSGSANTSVGYLSNAGSNTSDATGIGATANASAANSTALGYGATASAANATALGNGAAVSTANEIQLGNTSVTLVHTSGSYTGLSQGSLLGTNGSAATGLTVANSGNTNAALIVDGGISSNANGNQNGLTFNTTGGATYDVEGSGNTWNVSPAGAAHFTSIGLTAPQGSGAFTTLTSSGASTIATGNNLTNTFGAGTNAANTFGNASGTNAINGTTTVLGNTTINQTGSGTTAIGDPTVTAWWITAAGVANFTTSAASPQIYFNTADPYQTPGGTTMTFDGSTTTGGNPVITINAIPAASYGERINDAGTVGGIEITGTPTAQGIELTSMGTATGVDYDGSTGTGTGFKYANGTTGTGVNVAFSGAGTGVSASVNGAGAYTGGAGSVAIVGLQNNGGFPSAGVMGLNGVTAPSSDDFGSGVYGETNFSSGEAVGGVNSTTGLYGTGVIGFTTQATASSIGVFGEYTAGATQAYGVLGSTLYSFITPTTIANAAVMGYSGTAGIYAVGADNEATGGTALIAQDNAGGAGVQTAGAFLATGGGATTNTAITETVSGNSTGSTVLGLGGVGNVGETISSSGSTGASNIGSLIQASGNGSIAVDVLGLATGLSPITGVNIDASSTSMTGIQLVNVANVGANATFTPGETAEVWGYNADMSGPLSGEYSGFHVANLHTNNTNGMLVENMSAGNGIQISDMSGGVGLNVDDISSNAIGIKATVEVASSATALEVVGDGTRGTTALQVGDDGSGNGGNVVSQGNGGDGLTSSQNGWVETVALTATQQGETSFTILNSLVTTNSSILITVNGTTATTNGLVTVSNLANGSFQVNTTAATFGSTVDIYYMVVNH